jgi:parallel beta-helix repeat protein
VNILIRRNFLINLLLGVLAFFFGYTIKREGENLNLFKTDARMVQGLDGKKISDRLAQNAKQIEDFANNVTSYGVKGDGTDSVTAIQNIIDTISGKVKRVIFPYKGVFNFNNVLTVPANLEIDFNGSTITTSRQIVLNGSNITLRNLILKDTSPSSNKEGIYIADNVAADNLVLSEVTTDGFQRGIVVGNYSDASTVVSKNILVENCKTINASMWGIEFNQCDGVFVQNHYACYNKLDGLKTRKNCKNITINGGTFSNNSNNGQYADGIDLYAGAEKIRIIGVTCENNSLGGGIHIGSGDLNDPTITNPIHGKMEKITIESCNCSNNGFGIDISLINGDTFPYPGKSIISNCTISNNDGYGILLVARNTNISDCIVEGNGNAGIALSKSKNIVLNSNIILNNFEKGIVVESSKFVSINGGIIDGLSPATERFGESLSGTPSHINGIVVLLDANTDNIDINYPIIKNYTGTASIELEFKSAYPNAKVVYHLHDIGGDTLTNYYGSYGSTIIKDNRIYKKNTSTNSAVWDKEHIVRSGSYILNADGTKMNFTIPHGLGAVPTSFVVTHRDTAVHQFTFALQADETNLLLYFTNPMPSGTRAVNWRAEY